MAIHHPEASSSRPHTSLLCSLSQTLGLHTLHPSREVHITTTAVLLRIRPIMTSTPQTITTVDSHKPTTTAMLTITRALLPATHKTMVSRVWTALEKLLGSGPPLPAGIAENERFAAAATRMPLAASVRTAPV